MLRPPQPPNITHVHFPYQAEKQLRSFQWYQQYTPLPESPASAEPTNITYSGHSKYMTMSMTALPRNAPMAGARSAGFLRRDLSVQGPQNGATMSAGMVEKNVFPVMIFVAKLCT